MVPASTFVMQIFGGVREQRNPRKGPHQVQLVLDRCVVELGSQLIDRRTITETLGHRNATNAFDEIENRLTGLISNDVTKESSEQSNIVAGKIGVRSHGL